MSTAATAGQADARPRVALLGLFHESNTFVEELTQLEDFASVGIWRGQELWDAFAGSEATIGGYIAAAPSLGLELVPLHVRAGEPVGDDRAAALAAAATDELRAALADGGPWDAVLLALHGAAVAEDEPDVDGAIIEDVRGDRRTGDADRLSRSTCTRTSAHA